MSRLIRIYPYAAPAILAPLALYLWWQEYHNWPQTLMAWLIPVFWAYLVPGVGTNVRKVWEFDVRWKWGRFRPHHGFVFGSATAMMAWAVHGGPAVTIAGVFRYAVILCSVLGFWNLLYEVKALKSGMLKVYNQPWAEGQGAEAIALDYSPWIFGGVGAAYGLSIGAFEYVIQRWGMPSLPMCVVWWLAAFLLCVALPLLGFMQYSRRAHGHTGTRPVERKE
jgi:hypothetical protein